MKISMNELLIVLVIVILLFGPTQIPKLTKMLGKGVKDLRSETNPSEGQMSPDADVSGPEETHE